MYTPDKSAILAGIQKVGAMQQFADESYLRYPEEIEKHVKYYLAEGMAREIMEHVEVEKVYEMQRYLTVFKSTAYVVTDIDAHLAAIKREIERAYEKGVADAEGWTPPSSRNPDDLR